ncbi:MAG: hypothetical protein SGPRY_007278 [Prymnesium sp.]
MVALTDAVRLEAWLVVAAQVAVMEEVAMTRVEGVKGKAKTGKEVVAMVAARPGMDEEEVMMAMVEEVMDMVERMEEDEKGAVVAAMVVGALEVERAEEEREGVLMVVDSVVEMAEAKMEAAAMAEG